MADEESLLMRFDKAIAEAERRGAAQVLAKLRVDLAAHLTERTDPCEDRGVYWPCDVARALAVVTPEGERT